MMIHNLYDALEYAHNHRMEVVSYDGDFPLEEREKLADEYIIKGISVNADGSCLWGIRYIG